MTPEEFRRQGHALIDWLADHMALDDELPVMAPAQPGEIAARLPAEPPEAPEPFERLLADLDDVVVPGITRWQAPGWFAYFPTGASGPSVLAELASAGLGVQGMLWSTSPAATEIEQRVMDWLAQLLGLPAHWRWDTGPGGGSIQVSASDGTHLAHVVARHRTGEDVGRLVAYASSQAHSSVARGARIAGFAHVREVAVDERLALDPAALAAAVAEDRAAGLRPAIVTSAIGTTGTGAVDPVAAVAEVAQREGLWHHVDAAWAGAAMVLPEQRHHQAGIERVDSYLVNPHKWLLTNFDCTTMWWADREPLETALSDEPPYLRNAATESGAVSDLRNWQVPLGRRFRSLKLWWVLRAFGAEGLRELIGRHLALADELARRVDAHPRLEHAAPPAFALVSLRHVDGDAATDALAAAVNASGHSLVTPSSLPSGRFVRVSVGQERTDREHLDRLWAVLDAAA